MTTLRVDEVVGFSGHQTLSLSTQEHVRTEIMGILSRRGNILALTSLAAGSDQIFAECVLASGNEFAAVLPCRNYASTFSDPADLARYQRLLKSAVDEVQLPYKEPSEEAFWAAGKRIVDMADILLAVWDGEPAAGLGGTADVVQYALKSDKKVLHLWPKGASRK